MFLSFLSQTPINALLHVITLGWLAYVAANLKSIINPDLPFVRHASSSGLPARLCLNFLYIVVTGIVIFHFLASWMYINYTTYTASLLLGMCICIAVRLLARVRHDRKFLNADLVT